MPFKIDPRSTITNDSRVLSVAVSEDGAHIAFSRFDGTLQIYNSKGHHVKSREIEGRAGIVASRPNGGFVIGSIEGHLSAFDYNGEHSWTHKVGGGVEDLKTASGSIACLDGSGTVHLLDINGKVKANIKIDGAEKIVFDDNGRAFAVINSDGSVRLFSPDGEMMLEREPRNDRGERITAACFDTSGHLVIARETLGLANQGEDEVEIEWWTPLGERVDIQGLNTRCTHLSAYFTGILAGTFEGEVFIMSRNQEKVDLWKSPYSINSLTSLGKDVLVASWFYLYRIRGPDSKDGDDEPIWQVEHEGIVEFVSLDRDQTLLCIGGEDRNDYTGEEPILILDPDSEAKWFDEGSNDPWIQDLEIDDSVSPEGELKINDDYSSFLTEDEQAQMAGNVDGQNRSEEDSELLLSELTEGIEKENGTVEEVESSHEEILEGLVEEVGANRISPIANSGEDRTISADEDNTAVVTLDGGESYDPHERIQRWSWKDSRGKIIGEIAKIRVRLSKGKHRFELSVLDDDGVWTTDITFITVQ